MDNKTLIFFLLTLFVTIGIDVKCQTSMTGIVTTTANMNSIIRTWNDSLIVYAEESNGNAYFHLLNDLSNGAIVPYINLPENVRVNDFKVMDDKLFFVGTKGSTQAVAGTFDIRNAFYYGGYVEYLELSSYYYFNSNSDSISGKPLILKKMEVYRYNNDYHIIAIGESDEDQPTKTIRRNTGIYDIVITTSVFLNNYEVTPSFDGSIITDVIQTDDYIISLAHKGNEYNPSIPGDIMMHPYDKNAVPLQNPSGYILHHLNVSPNGFIMGTGMANNDFVITGCTPDPVYYTTLSQQEYISFNVVLGTIASIAPARWHTNILTSNNFNTIRDIAYNPITKKICDIDDFTSASNVLSIHHPTSFSLHKLSSPNCKLNSVCSMTTTECAVSGYHPSGLYILTQDLSSQSTCELLNPISIGQDAVALIPGGTYYHGNGKGDNKRVYPQKADAGFHIICKQ